MIMKKKILLILSIISSSLVMAQEKTTFGIKAGVLASEMKGDAVNSLNDLLNFNDGMVSTKGRTGFFAGVNANIPISKNLSVEPGIYYAQKGYELTGDFAIKGLEFLGANARAQLQSDYIDIPLLLKFNMDGLQLFAGPQVSYLTKANLKTTAGLLGINLLDENIDATQQFNRWDAGLTGGVGFQFNNGMNISAAYDYGLLKVDSKRSFDSYNRGFKIGLGINF